MQPEQARHTFSFVGLDVGLKKLCLETRMNKGRSKDTASAKTKAPSD
jgi:hypothetical protein